MKSQKQTKKDGSTATTQSDLLNTQLGVEGEPNKENSILARRENILGTPFYLVQTETHWFVSFNKYRITGEYAIGMDTNEEIDELAKNVLEEDKWFVIMRMCGIMQEIMRENPYNKENG